MAQQAEQLGGGAGRDTVFHLWVAGTNPKAPLGPSDRAFPRRCAFQLEDLSGMVCLPSPPPI